MPRTKKQFEEIRKSRRDKILSVALELFAQKGFNGTTVAEIARKADISKGLLYNYFKNKEALLNSIINDGLNIISEIESGSMLAETPENQLRAIITQSLDHLYNNIKYWQLFLALMIHPVVQKKYEKKMQVFRDEFVKQLSEIFKKLGSKNSELDAFLLGTFFDGLALNFIAAGDTFPVDKIKKSLMSIYIKSGSRRK